MITRPTTPTGWLDNYINLVKDESLIEGFKNQTSLTLEFLSPLTDEQLNFRYAEGKWSIREIIVHLVDTERIFGYRALRFSRNDKTELPGYDENLFAENSYASNRTLNSLLEEYIIVRTATVALFSNLQAETLHRTGIANGVVMTPAALGFAILGHEKHHLRIISERYLSVKNVGSGNGLA